MAPRHPVGRALGAVALRMRHVAPQRELVAWQQVTGGPIARQPHLAIDDHGFSVAFDAAVQDFSWRCFAAIQIWIFTCFLIWVMVTELSNLLGEGQLFRLFFRHRSSQHRLTRRQHVRALMELSRLAETTPREKLLDPGTPQGQRLLTIVDALRQRSA